MSSLVSENVCFTPDQKFGEPCIGNIFAIEVRQRKCMLLRVLETLFANEPRQRKCMLLRVLETLLAVEIQIPNIGNTLG